MSRLQGLLARHDRRSTIAMLYAAALSPTASHRLPSIAIAINALDGVTRHGLQPAEANDLAAVLAAARRTRRRVAHFEDFVGGDPRHDVGAFDEGHRWRIHPSTYEHALAVIAELRLLALVDPHLIEQFGFGTQDVLAVMLAASDAQMTAMNAVWHAGPPASPDVEPTISDDELLAAAAMFDEGHLYAEPATTWFPWPANSTQAAALQWATGKCQLRLARREPLFGAVLAYSSPNGPLMLPASALLDSATAVCDRLVQLAHHEPEVTDAMLEVREHSVAAAISLLRGQIVESSDQPGGLHAIVQMTDRRHIEFHAPFTREQFDAAVEAAGAATEGDASASADTIQIVLADGAENLNAARGIIVTDTASFAASVRDQDAIAQWHFLADIAYHDGIGIVAAADLWDCVPAWERHHAFPPGIADAPAVYIRPDPTRTSWDDAARWAPYDSILVAAGLPQARQFGGKSIQEDTTAALITSDSSHLVLVSLQPPVAIVIVADPATELGDSTYGLADALLIASQQMPELAELFAPNGLDPLRLLTIEVVSDLEAPTDLGGPARPRADEPDDADDDVGPTAAFSVSEDRRHLNLRLNQTVLEAIAKDPDAGHLELGDLLATMFEVALHRPPEPIDAFRDAWTKAEPIIRFEFFETTTRHSPVPRARLHPAAAGWARRQLALHRSSRSNLILSGDAATAICRTEICPAVIELLDSIVAPLDPVALLQMALSELDRAWAARLQRRRSLDLAREAPWSQAHHEEGQRADELDMLLCRASEIAIERVVAAEHSGDRVPDLVDWSRALALAGLAAEAAQLVGGATAQLHSLVVTFDEFGCFHPIGAGPGRHDESAYQAALLAAKMAETAEESAPVRSKNALDAASTEVLFTPFPRGDKYLSAIDEQMTLTLGFGFDALLATLGDAVSRPPVDGVVTVNTADLVESATAWAPVTSDAIAAAIHFLTLDRDELRTTDYQYWKLDKRAQRLAARPFIADGAHVRYAPHRVRWTQELCLSYMRDGRLPWPDLPTPVQREVARWRKEKNRLLERHVEEVLRDMRMKVRRNVKPDLFARHGISVGGEVDVLAADPRHNTLWVLEAKDFQAAFGLTEIAANIDKLHGEGRFIDRLLDRTSSVRAASSKTAAFLGADPERPWVVEPLVVTAVIERAAYVPESRAPIVAVADLHDWITGRH